MYDNSNLNVKQGWVARGDVVINFERQRGRTCSLEKFYYAQYSVHKAVPLKRSDGYLIDRVRFNVISRYQTLPAQINLREGLKNRAASIWGN